MPKRTSIPLTEVAEWANLTQAVHQAAQGKRDRGPVQRFFADFDRSIATVQRCVLAARLVEGRFRSFMIRDPKVRTIHAAPFADRVVHHALVNRMKATFERGWVDHSYACRVGKGSHRAVVYAQAQCQRYPWVVKLDVSAYFARIDHGILLALLARRFKGRGLFRLLTAVLQSFALERGLPIGALTSQYFANHYLDGFQRFLRAQPQVLAECRYMDDVLMFTGDRAHARALATEADRWLRAERRLTLKPAIIQCTPIGVTFCGFKVSAGALRLGRRRKRQYRTRLRELLDQAQQPAVDELALQARAQTLRALCMPGDHTCWQRQHWPCFDEGQAYEV